jgi:hypothetical protein
MCEKAGSLGWLLGGRGALWEALEGNRGICPFLYLSLLPGHKSASFMTCCLTMGPKQWDLLLTD